MTYVPVHLHTSNGSIGDSIIRLAQLITKSKELNIKALTITNHGSLADMYEFYTTCIDNNIKPIIGCEIYLTPDRLDKTTKESYHMILIAYNNKGITNLLDIVSNASTEGFYYRPRTDMQYIKEHSEGLICLTACVGGYLPQLILNNKTEEAKQHLSLLQSIFNDKLFLEIQPGNFEEQIKVNNGLIELHNETGVELIVSNDIHYLNKEEWKTHDFHVRIQRKVKAPENPEETLYPDRCYYLMSREELIQSFNNSIDSDLLIAALDNTNKIAEISNISFELDKINLPEFECPNGLTPEDYVRELCYNRLDNITNIIPNPNEYVERIEYEISVLKELGYLSYFLIMWDLLKYAYENDIEVGPARGSVSASLIAYLLNITKVNPIRFDLMFERFLSKYRRGLPDIDLDFSSGYGRESMFNYTIKKYGINHCAAVSTKQVRKAKSSIKDVGRLLGIDLSIVETISKLIPTVYYDDIDGEKLTDLSITESLNISSELREYQSIYPELFDMAIKLEGLTRASSIHAAGTLITNTPVQLTAPLVKQDSKELLATALDLEQAEYAKLLKFDYLGLSTLNVLKSCREQTGHVFDYDTEKYDDSETWKSIGSKNTTGIFQIASRTYKQRMYRLKPTNIEELSACLALVRGPCISSKLDEKYMRIIEGKEMPEPIHPVYDEATKDTNYIMLYQEQVIQICVNMGLSNEDGFTLMKAGAKNKVDVIESYRMQLYNRKDEYDISEEQFNRIFGLILDSAKYSFNKGHSTSYSLITYMTAYYKTHHPLEFFAAEITNIYKHVSSTDRKRRIEETIEDCRRLGIQFLPFDINKSKEEFIVENDKIRLGYCSLPSLGDEALRQLLNNKPYTTNPINQILEKIPKNILSKRAMIPLILSGVLGDREEIYMQYMSYRKEEPKSELKLHKTLTIDLYDYDHVVEQQLLHESYCYSPLNKLSNINYKAIKNNNTFSTTVSIKRAKPKRDKNGNMMCFLTLIAGFGSLEAVVFSSQYKELRSLLKVNNMLNITARKQDDNCCIIIKADKI